ncbi:MAG: DUF3285 domain-containing protein [Cyanobacteria bacterium J06614_10]
MSPDPVSTTVTESSAPEPSTAPKPKSTLDEPTPSFIKLAMRNMVKKGGKSLYHFFLSFVGLLGLLIGLSYLTR